jgi:hypothetical protein
LLRGEQLPTEHREFARDGDDRDLRAAARADALIERAQRARGLDRRPGGLYENVAHGAGSFLGDAPIPRRAEAGLAHACVQAEVADELLADGKRRMSPIAAISVAAVVASMPGIVISRLISGLSSACLARC